MASRPRPLVEHLAPRPEEPQRHRWRPLGVGRDLVEHARQKTALLVQGSVEAILENNKIEETFISRLRIMEREKRRLCLDLGRAFRIPREEFTLMKLADHLDPSFALELREQAALFRNLVHQLKSVSRRNMRLIENSMHMTHNLDPVQWDQDKATEILYCGKESVMLLDREGNVVCEAEEDERGLRLFALKF